MAKRDSSKPTTSKAGPRAAKAVKALEKTAKPPRESVAKTKPVAQSSSPAQAPARTKAQVPAKAAAKGKPAAVTSAKPPSPAPAKASAKVIAGKVPASKAAAAKSTTAKSASAKSTSAKSDASKPSVTKPAAGKSAAPKAAPRQAAPPAAKLPTATAPELRRAARTGTPETVTRSPTEPLRPKLVAIEGGAARRTVAETAGPSAAAAPKAAHAALPPAAAPPRPDAAGDDPFRFQAMDVEQLSSNVARMIELGGKALAAYLKPRETGMHADSPDGVTDVVKTLGHVAEFWLKDPARSMAAQSQVAESYINLWSQSLKAMTGEPADPVAKPEPRDGRFKDPQWEKNPFFDFLKQFYLVTTQLAEKFVVDAELDEHLKHKAAFYTRQIANALSPSNFVPTNPELLRETIGSNGENLVRGMAMLAEDIERGGGDLRIRQSDDTPFALGKNLAMTPGKVVYENDLIQLIQYEPTTERVGKIPLVIVPPWINKFYILDLVQEKSFIKWAVDQGLTVFVISWVNPDQRHASKSFDDYMLEGPLAAFRVASEITGEKDVHAIGYCVGGTLLAVALAYMAAKGIDNVKTATFFTTQVDFTYAGDLKVFVDEAQIQSLEKRMAQTGYLEGKQMANAFNMLRSNDLIWSYFVNNYMKGKQPMPFDLLYWNADSPRMPAANHSFYLRHCYLQNDLSQGRMEVGGVKLDLKKVKVPVYNLASREDHIAPARSVFVGSSAFGGPVEYVVAGSGHIAGVVNPPAKKKYQHWLGGPPVGSFEEWIDKATEHPGSWWPHWREWVRARDGKEVPARKPGSAKYKPIEDAPGRYVKVKD